MDLAGALKEYHNIVISLSKDYTKEELTIEIIRKEHEELNFFDDDELEELITFANSIRVKDCEKKAKRKEIK